MKWILASTACLIILCLGSCSKESTTKSKKSILTSKNWQWTGFSVHGVASVMDTCNLDDYYSFNSNGNYDYIATRVLCSNQTTNHSGHWSLSSDEKKLTLDVIANYSIDINESRIILTSSDSVYGWVFTGF